MTPKLYLAGPDVFLPDANKVGAAKKAICSEHGLVGVFPSDHVVLAPDMGPREQGRAIAAVMERLMADCEAMIVNLTPFHGPSMDVGSAFEVGFMRALGRPIFAYSNVSARFPERIGAFFGGRIAPRADGRLADPYGMEVENFDLVDNLMIDGGIIASGGFIVCEDAREAERYTSLSAFRRCVENAARALTGRHRPV